MVRNYPTPKTFGEDLRPNLSLRRKRKERIKISIKIKKRVSLLRRATARLPPGAC